MSHYPFKKVLIVTDFDSRIAWSLAFASIFAEQGYVVDMMLYERAIFTKDQSTIINTLITYKHLDEVIEGSLRRNYDAILLALGGAQHLKFIYKMKSIVHSKQLTHRPILITGFNGIEDFNDPHGLYCRTGSDIICVNSPKIYQQYKNFLKEMDIEDDVLYLTGYIRPYWDDHVLLSQTSKIKHILFVLQPGLLDHKKQLEYMGRKILEYCQCHPDREFYIKPRGPKKGLHVNSAIEKKYFMLFWEKLCSRGPKNISLVYDDISFLLRKSDLVISFTSAALMEGIILNKQVVAISDFGISRAIGNVYLLKSNIFCSFDDVIHDNIPNVSSQWKSENITFSKDAVLNVIHCVESLLHLQSKNNRALPFPKAAYTPEKHSYLFRLLEQTKKNIWWKKIINKIRFL